MTRRMLYLPALIVARVLLACAAALLALLEKAEATFPGKNGKISYVFYGGGGGIYTTNPGGGGNTKVANGGEGPAYSPNGKRIAYTSYKVLGSSDDEDFDCEIYMINIGRGGKSQVTNTKYPSSEPSWGSRP